MSNDNCLGTAVSSILNIFQHRCADQLRWICHLGTDNISHLLIHTVKSGIKNSDFESPMI
jgi:hypothetical protein